MLEERQKHHPWGHDGRVRPEDLVPRDEEEAVGPSGPPSDVVIRALSVIPFLLLAVFGLIGIVSWFFVFIFGAGPGDPIWEAVRGHTAAQVAGQLLLVLVVGLIPLAVVLATSWATERGFRRDSGRTFWSVAESVWSLIGLESVYVWVARRDLIGRMGLSGASWWFLFGVVAFAMICAAVRLRRAPRSATR